MKGNVKINEPDFSSPLLAYRKNLFTKTMRNWKQSNGQSESRASKTKIDLEVLQTSDIKESISNMKNKRMKSYEISLCMISKKNRIMHKKEIRWRYDCHDDTYELYSVRTWRWKYVCWICVFLEGFYNIFPSFKFSEKNYQHFLSLFQWLLLRKSWLLHRREALFHEEH